MIEVEDNAADFTSGGDEPEMKKIRSDHSIGSSMEGNSESDG